MLGKGRSTSSVLSNDFTSSDTLGKWVGRLGRRGAYLKSMKMCKSNNK